MCFWASGLYVKCVLLIAILWEGTVLFPNWFALWLVTIYHSLLPTVDFLLFRTAYWFWAEHSSTCSFNLLILWWHGLFLYPFRRSWFSFLFCEQFKQSRISTPTAWLQLLDSVLGSPPPSFASQIYFLTQNITDIMNQMCPGSLWLLTVVLCTSALLPQVTWGVLIGQL